MSHSLDVHVLDKHGSPVTGAAVRVFIDGFWKGGGIDAYTDSSGHAELETAEDYENSRKLSITVRGRSFGPFRIGDGRWTVTLD